MSRPLALLVLLASVPTLPAADLTFDEADARLRRAYALAREFNDQAAVDRVLAMRDGVKKSLDRKDVVAAERQVRDAEEAAGLDPGGKTMLGLPIARIDPEVRKKLDGVEERLAAAMKKDDVPAAAAATAEMISLLGDQAGVPDLRRKGETGKPVPAKPADVADVFLKAVQADPRALKAMLAGVPSPEALPRGYASVVEGCLAVRPLVERFQKDKLEVIDGLIHGGCRAMLALQTEAGFFKFPDLRGRNMRIGDAIEKLVDKDPDAVRDGWVVAPLPDGASQVEAGECGIALLRAGAALNNDTWTAAGRKAADWGISVPPVPAFHYNAYSVSLLCEAYRVTSAAKYLEGATRKYRVGVRGGQTKNGRWADPVSARTASHLVLLRALHDLMEATPAGKDRDAIIAQARAAMAPLVEEAKNLGAPVTANTVQELERHLRLAIPAGSEVSAVRAVLEQAASGTVQRCIHGGRVRAAAPLPELAAVGRVWAK